MSLRLSLTAHHLLKSARRLVVPSACDLRVTWLHRLHRHLSLATRPPLKMAAAGVVCTCRIPEVPDQLGRSRPISTSVVNHAKKSKAVSSSAFDIYMYLP